MKDVMIIGGFIDSIRPRKDKSAFVTIETQELTPDQKGLLGRWGGEYIYFAMKRENFTNSEVDFLGEIKATATQKKKKSLTLRQILWRLWSEQNEGFDDPEEHYNFYMDKFIQQVRERL